MSVILDALKKAEADRQKDGVPEIRGAQSTARLANDRQRRLWFIALLGTLVCTGAAWFTFVGKPVQPFASPTAAQNATEVTKSAGNAVMTPAEATQVRQPIGERQIVDATTQNAFGLVQSSSEGGSVTNSDAFLPAPAPELLQFSTSAAKRAAAEQNTMASLPSLAIPNTGAAQPVFVQGPKTLLEPVLESPPATALVDNIVKPPSNSAQATAYTITPGTEPEAPAAQMANPEIKVSTNAPSPDLVLQAAKQTAAAAADVPELYQLDYPTRHALPKLGLTLHVFDANPARSFVIVNNKRFAEGEQIEGTVLVAKIRREGVECEFNGQRFILPRQL